MILVGLTGGVATGKSAVAEMFSRLGVATADTDLLVHGLLRKGEGVYRKIIKIFGRDILKKNGEIDRKKLAGVVFASSSYATKLRRKLELIIHPAVYREVMKMAKKKGRGIFIIEVPLLFEVGWDKKVDLTITVVSTPAVQRKRCKRPLVRRIGLQLPLWKKAAMADFVIDNSGNLADTRLQVKKIYNEILCA